MAMKRVSELKLLALGAFWLAAPAILIYILRRAPPLSCERCGIWPATEETSDHRDLCEICWNERLHKE